MKNLLLFDCDQTIWTSGNHDFIGSVVSPLVPVSKNSILRVKDGSIFTLKEGVPEVFDYLKKTGNIVGIISDNRKGMVTDALKLFNMYKFVNLSAVSVKLWKGYCPKHTMIQMILEKNQFKSIPLKNVYWFDDKDYSQEAGLIKVNYVHVSKNTKISKIVENIINK